MGVRWWILTPLAILMIIASWVMATPPLAGPDEPSHIIAAVADAQGQTNRPQVPGNQPARQEVLVPETYALLPTESLCIVFGSGPANCRIPARFCRTIASTISPCGLPVVASDRIRAAVTYTARYQPLYPTIVGLPSLVSAHTWTIRAMRTISGLLCAVLLFGAFGSVARWGGRPLLIAGSLLAVTPMAWGLSGVVNPGALEICAAICLWASGLALIGIEGKPPLGLLAIVGVSATVFAFSRPLSPAWLVVILTVLGILAGKERLKVILALRPARIWVGIVGIATIASVVWVLATHATLALIAPITAGHRRSALDNALKSYAMTGRWFHEMVGVLGWSNAPTPWICTALWAAGTVALIILGVKGLRGAPWTVSLGAAICLAAALSVPAVLSVAIHRPPELFYIGRYGLPLAVGVVLVAGTIALEGRRVSRIVGFGVIGAASIGHAIGFLAVFHRWTVGANGPFALSGNGPGVWSPSINPYLLAAIALSGIALLAWQLCDALATEASELP